MSVSKGACYASLSRLWVPNDVLEDVIAEADLFGAEVKRISRNAGAAAKLEVEQQSCADGMMRPEAMLHDC